jgi:hypothetical protein
MSSSCSRFDVLLECLNCSRRGEARAQRYGGWSNSDRDARVHYHEVSRGFVALSAHNGHEGYDVACGGCGSDARIRRAHAATAAAEDLVDPASAFVPRTIWDVATSGFRQKSNGSDRVGTLSDMAEPDVEHR